MSKKFPSMVDCVRNWIASGETHTIEFKSDRRQISDGEIYEEIVALANTDGGVLLIGVEDEGRVSGAKPRHGNGTDPLKLRSAIFNNTVPNINTRVSVVEVDGKVVIAVEVDPYPEPCATAQGRSLQRATGGDAKPQTIPLYPRDQRTRRMDLGLLDFSAQTLNSLNFSDLDPIEFERLKQAIVRLRGDRALLELPNEEIAKALRLVESHGERLVPNVAGLLLLGRAEILRAQLPTHEVAFQVLDGQGNVRVNELLSAPLLLLMEDLEGRFSTRNEEQELTVGLIRYPVPDYSPQGFREALSNALLHRDYSQLGPVYIQWYPDHLLLTNPGGFVSNK